MRDANIFCGTLVKHFRGIVDVVSSEQLDRHVENRCGVEEGNQLHMKLIHTRLYPVFLNLFHTQTYSQKPDTLTLFCFLCHIHTHNHTHTISAVMKQCEGETGGDTDYASDASRCNTG